VILSGLKKRRGERAEHEWEKGLARAFNGSQDECGGEEKVHDLAKRTKHGRRLEKRKRTRVTCWVGVLFNWY